MKLSSHCPECAADVSWTVGQHLDDATLRWSRSLRCCSCGCAIEEDGSGFPPREYRAQLLNNQAPWQLVAGSQTSGVALARGLRHYLGISLSDAVKLIKSMPGVVWTGTEVEVRWLVEALRKRDITVEAMAATGTATAASSDTRVSADGN